MCLYQSLDARESNMAETMMNPDLFPGLRQYLVEHFGPQAGRRLIFPGATEADEEP